MTSSNVAGVRCQTLGALVETGWGCLVLFSLVVSHFGQGAIRHHAAGQGAIRQGVPSWHQRWACSRKEKDKCLVLV